MKLKKWIAAAAAGALCLSLLAGCGASAPQADTSLCVTDFSAVTVPEDTQIVGLGESSHGASEYHKLKSDLFRALVEKNGCRTFIIEGDFGGCLKVDAYIHGGSGTAEQALSQIGFAIYRTQELADLVNWMRTYNETAPEGKDLHFYGMDQQRFDNNKAYLFSVLDSAGSALSAQYQQAFAPLTDESRVTLDNAALEQGKSDATQLIIAMQDAESDLTAACGATQYAFALECAKSIYNCCDITSSGNNYNEVRDSCMAAKINWFAENGDGSMLFVNGHNGHIGKVSAYGYNCLGAQLAETYGSGYFSIATDAADTKFSSQTDTGFTPLEVKNSNAFTAQLGSIPGGWYYLDFSAAEQDSTWQGILHSAQRMTVLNVELPAWQCSLAPFYTASLVPADTYNAIFVYAQTTPTSVFEYTE